MMNILVIDDEKAILSMIAKVLTKIGFNVATALDGLEGIKRFDEGNYQNPCRYGQWFEYLILGYACAGMINLNLCSYNDAIPHLDSL